MKLTIAGKEVDFSKAVPLTLGDQEKIEHELNGVDGQIARAIRTFHVVAVKANPAVTLDDVRTLTGPQMQTVSAYIAEAGERSVNPNG